MLRNLFAGEVGVGVGRMGQALAWVAASDKSRIGVRGSIMLMLKELAVSSIQSMYGT